MQRNIVVCSDGTTNAFGYGDTNVATLLRALNVSEPSKQLVFYEQGIGSNPKRIDKVKEYKSGLGADGLALIILPPPVEKFPAPITRLAGQLVEYGLKENLKEMYRALCTEASARDRVYLFGFSRGAFTVRALAGLIHHCNLLKNDSVGAKDNFDRLFDEAFLLFKEHYTDRDNQQKTRAFKKRNTECSIAFLGIWDTVKSYGGICPVTLPHLRHNPSVERICHAIAMDEHRTWYKDTTWGWLDSDRKNAPFIADDPRYSTQEIKEVWFPGYHTDVGGGGPGTWPFRWLFGEACEPSLGLLLNKYGRALLDTEVPLPNPSYNPRDSEHFLWRLSSLVPRFELDNEHRMSDGSASKRWRWGATGKRDMNSARRREFVCIHSSVGVSDVHNEDWGFRPERGWTASSRRSDHAVRASLWAVAVLALGLFLRAHMRW